MTEWLLRNSLWLVGLGLMLASSGIDGAYMALWMNPGWGWLGYVLNTVSDLATLVISYWYGRLLRVSRSDSKRARLTSVLLGAEAVSVAYSWFFSFRMLRRTLVDVEGDATRWVAPVSAAFIPLLLAFIGWAQSLIMDPPVGRRRTTGRHSQSSGRPMAQSRRPVDTTEPPPDTTGAPPVSTGAPVAIAEPTGHATVAPVVTSDGPPVDIGLDQWRHLVTTLDGDRPVDGAAVNQWLSEHGYAPKPLTTARRWAREVRP